ncbi:MAG: helix-turn-helix domain-containing protein [Chlorobi bacterium CHB2]|nr:helix-turn-helix domain-containing protein [Chlorobi bacterium CHB2]
MARSFNELRAAMPPERQAKNKAQTEDLLRLYELRQALRLSQEQIAESLKIKQSTVSKMERNTDILISTLRRYLEAMGARLVIKAEFPGGTVEINQFQDLELPTQNE